jgi:hypothetical protein
MTGDRSIKSLWTSIFSRKGGSDTCTRIWDDWDEESKTGALRDIDLQPGELPVVMAKSPLGTLIVLTSRRLFCLPHVTDVQDIMDIKPCDFGLKNKDQLSELNIELASGNFFLLSVASGPSYFALWNLLLHICRKNSREELVSDR